MIRSELATVFPRRTATIRPFARLAVMRFRSDNRTMTPISISSMLSVRRGAEAVEFYKSALGADVVYRIDAPDGAVVARLSIDGAEFWVADESPEHKNFSPETLGGGTVRMSDDCGRPGYRVRQGCCCRSRDRVANRKPTWLALRKDRRSVRTPLGDWQADIVNRSGNPPHSSQLQNQSAHPPSRQQAGSNPLGRSYAAGPFSTSGQGTVIRRSIAGPL